MVQFVMKETIEALGPVERIFAEQLIKSGEWVVKEMRETGDNPVSSPVK